MKTNTILFDHQHSGYKIRVLTPDDLKRGYIHSRYLNVYDINNPKDISEIFGNVEGYSPVYEFPTGYESKSLNMQTMRNTYIHSSMGNYNTIRPQGESTIIRKRSGKCQ